MIIKPILRDLKDAGGSDYLAALMAILEGYAKILYLAHLVMHIISPE
jgi:hypothetical protein